jgi:hypothetical protein
MPKQAQTAHDIRDVDIAGIGKHFPEGVAANNAANRGTIELEGGAVRVIVALKNGVAAEAGDREKRITGQLQEPQLRLLQLQAEDQGHGRTKGGSNGMPIVTLLFPATVKLEMRLS